MRLLALMFVALTACTMSDAIPIDEAECPPSGTTLTYANFGAAFFADHCNRCHSTATSGAPPGVRFDTIAEIRARSGRIFIRSAGPNVSMPPGPNDPPADERDQLAEWLACGAPE